MHKVGRKASGAALYLCNVHLCMNLIRGVHPMAALRDSGVDGSWAAIDRCVALAACLPWQGAVLPVRPVGPDQAMACLQTAAIAVQADKKVADVRGPARSRHS